MAQKKPKRIEVQVAPGFNPSPDSTELDSLQCVDGDKMRFYNGKFQTVYGCEEISTGSNTVSGCTRFLINFRLNDNNTFSVIGSDEKLYSLLGNTLTNITPFSTTSTSISNAIASNYATLGADPFTTTTGSKTITATWASHKLIVGDTVSLTGATNTNGIPATEINLAQFVQSVGASTFTFTVATTAASSSGTGGGSNVTAATDLATVTLTSHGLSTGDRVKASGATDVGGIAAANINGEHLVRVNSTGTFTFTCNGDYASSSASSSGGTQAVAFFEIADGQCEATLGYGYGMGLYGVGRYGVAKTGYYPTLPRIWSGDFFGSYLILCPGTTGNSVGASIYQWAGSTSTAPTVVTNAPTDATYVFVDNNILVALCDTVVKWSDQGDQTDWTAAATNQAGSQTLYGSGRLLSRAFINGENLLYSATNVYRMRYIGKPFVWEFEKLDVADGISGVHAAVSYDGAVFWMGRRDFYMYSGGSLRQIAPSSLREYIFQRVKTSQYLKTHAWLNVKYGEIWWFYQSNNATEIDSYVVYSIPEKCWMYGTWARTASERNYIMPYQRLVGADNKVYEHEKGNDNNGSALNWYIETNYGHIAEGDDTMDILGMMFDTVQTNNAALTVYTKLSPQSTTERTFGPYTITASSSDAIAKVDLRAHGRMRKIKISSSETESFFRMGKTYELLQLADGR